MFPSSYVPLLIVNQLVRYTVPSEQEVMLQSNYSIVIQNTHEITKSCLLYDLKSPMFSITLKKMFYSLNLLTHKTQDSNCLWSLSAALCALLDTCSSGGERIHDEVFGKTLNLKLSLLQRCVDVYTSVKHCKAL